MPTTTEKFKECFDLFGKGALDEQTIPYSCKIHDAFGGLGKEHHNCLGCNFTESVDLILEYLRNHEKLDHTQQHFSIYIMSLYLLVERIDMILGIIQLPDSYKEKHFKVFQKIRKWSNFIKHPKSFILTHHPTYDFSGSGTVHSNTFSITIDDNTYYKGAKGEDQKKMNNELYIKLKNKKNVLVLYPDIAILTKDLCFAFRKFVDMIINNEIFIEILNDETTIANYFENEA